MRPHGLDGAPLRAMPHVRACPRLPEGMKEKRVTMAAVRAPRSLRQSSPPDQNRRRVRRRHLDGASHADGHHRPTSARWPQPCSLHGATLTAIATPTTRRCYQRYAANLSPLCPRTGASPCPDRAGPRSRIPCLSRLPRLPRASPGTGNFGPSGAMSDVIGKPPAMTYQAATAYCRRKHKNLLSGIVKSDGFKEEKRRKTMNQRQTPSERSLT